MSNTAKGDTAKSDTFKRHTAKRQKCCLCSELLCEDDIVWHRTLCRKCRKADEITTWQW